MVGRLLSYWEGNFSGAMLKFQGVSQNDLLNELLTLLRMDNEKRSYSAISDHEIKSFKRLIFPI